MNSSDSRKGPHLPQPTAGMRISSPPPIPPEALRRSYPPPCPTPSPEPADEEPSVATNPNMDPKAIEFIEMAKRLYPAERFRLGQNGNARPALQLHLKRAREEIILKLESQSLYFSKIRVKWVALAAAAIAIAASAGLAIHSCAENTKLEQRIEQLEKDAAAKKSKAKPPAVKEKAKPTSFYIPKALSSPPRFPNRIPQRVARNSLRA